MIWTAKFWMSLMSVVMSGGLIHTMIISSDMNLNTHQTHIVTDLKNMEKHVVNHYKAASVTNTPVTKKNALNVNYTHSRAIHETVSRIKTEHVYSYRTKLLADLISQRYTHSNYHRDLLIASYINKYTKGLVWPDPLAVAAIIEIESQYQPNVVSDCGARGLMQISPVWSNRIPSTAYTSIKGNIKYGIYILRYYYKMYNGNRMAAILSYNSGNGAYNAGQAWPVYWYRFENAKGAFDKLYSLNS